MQFKRNYSFEMLDSGHDHVETDPAIPRCHLTHSVPLRGKRRAAEERAREGEREIEMESLFRTIRWILWCSHSPHITILHKIPHNIYGVDWRCAHCTSTWVLQLQLFSLYTYVVAMVHRHICIRIIKPFSIRVSCQVRFPFLPFCVFFLLHAFCSWRLCKRTEAHKPCRHLLFAKSKHSIFFRRQVKRKKKWKKRWR